MLSQIIGFGVQPNKAIVGRNAFAHEAGIHQHGVISNPLCYEIMTPESVGVPANELVLGKHSGRHALALRYQELGYALTAGELDAAYHRFHGSCGSQKANLRSGSDLADGHARSTARRGRGRLGAFGSGISLDAPSPFGRGLGEGLGTALAAPLIPSPSPNGRRELQQTFKGDHATKNRSPSR